MEPTNRNTINILKNILESILRGH
ncbi:protein of unknown function (plasmid) [Azospirillum baldaniorum]|uniref:Uncharacterized protein n=1 Tax=Azospirillum baldaniorum TaxID=1064539 RepID=A0A9P1NTB4_9PROT|nr:protein of unknown function [Azospirillum baldaniorum]